MLIICRNIIDLEGDRYEKLKIEGLLIIAVLTVSVAIFAAGAVMLFKYAAPKIKRICVNIIASAVIVSASLMIITPAVLGMNLQSAGDLTPREDDRHGPQGSIKSGTGATYFLVAGIDDDNNTDVMMMVCWDFATGAVNMLQIPRDTFVGVRYRYGKFNGAYSTGGSTDQARLDSLVTRINKTVGMPVDHYFLVNLSALRKIVDIVGGVEVDMPKQYTLYDIPTGRRYTIEGKTLLNGQQAEDLMRHRKTYLRGDEERVEAQRYFYAGFIMKMLQMDKNVLTDIVVKCYAELKTDMDIKTLTDYSNAARKLNAEDMGIYAIPGRSHSTTVSGIGVNQSYFSMYADEYVELLNNKFAPYYKNPVTRDDLEIYELVTPNGYHDIDVGGSLIK
jgi:LCP family protein required for cell wall assembly